MNFDSFSIDENPIDQQVSAKPDDFSSLLGIVGGETWSSLNSADRKASSSSAFSRYVKELEKDKTKKFIDVDHNGEEKEYSMFHPDGTYSQKGKEHLNKALSFLSVAADHPNGGVEVDPITGESGISSDLSPILSGKNKAADPFKDFDSLRDEVKNEVVDGKAKDFTYDEFVDRKNKGKNPDSPAFLDKDNEQMRAAFESRKKMSEFDLDKMGDSPVDLVEGVPVFNPKFFTRPDLVEAKLDTLGLSKSELLMNKIHFRDLVNKHTIDAIRNAASAEQSDFSIERGGIVAPLVNYYGGEVKDALGVERQDLLSKFQRHSEKKENSDSYSFIKENQEMFKDDRYGWGDKVTNAFWNANRSTGIGAALLLTGFQSKAVKDVATISAEENDRAFEGMGGTESYRVLGMDFTNKGMFDMAGQVTSILATAGFGASVKAGVAIGARIAAKAGIATIAEGATNIGLKGLAQKGLIGAGTKIAESDAFIQASVARLAPNTAKNLAIKALRDPSAYIGSLQAGGMSFGSKFNEVLDKTGDYDLAYNKAQIQSISDGLSAFIATSVFNRIAPGAEKMMSGVEGSLSQSLVSRIKYAKALKSEASKKATIEALEGLKVDETMRKAVSKGLAEIIDVSAKKNGLKGWGGAPGVISEFFEEATDSAISDVVSAVLDDSKNWTDEVWNNIGSKFSEYMSAGVMGAFGGGMGEAMGSVSTFSKENEKNRVNAIKQHSELIWKKIAGNVEEFNPSVNELSVDKRQVAWAEYIANSPDTVEVKAEKLAKELYSGMFTEDNVSAVVAKEVLESVEAKASEEASSEEPIVEGDVIPAPVDPAVATDEELETLAEARSTKAPAKPVTDEGIELLTKLGVASPSKRTIKPGLVIQEKEPIPVGNVGTLTPISIGVANNAAAKWTKVDGSTEVITAQAAVKLLNSNLPFGGRFSKQGKASEAFAKSVSREKEIIQNEWTTEQSKANNVNSSQVPITSQKVDGDRGATKGERDSSPTGSSRVDETRRNELSPSTEGVSGLSPTKDVVEEELGDRLINETNDSIISRTEPGKARNEAYAARRRAALAKTDKLKKGDVVLDEDGVELIVDSNPGEGLIFFEGQGDSMDVAAGLVPAGRMADGSSANIVQYTIKTLPVAEIPQSQETPIPEPTSPAITVGKIETEPPKPDGQENNETNAQTKKQGQVLKTKPLPLVQSVLEKQAQEDLQDVNTEEELRAIVNQSFDDDTAEGEARHFAAQRKLERFGVKLEAANPTKAKQESRTKTEYTIDSKMLNGGVDSKGGSWSPVVVDKSKGAESFTYTPAAGKTLKYDVGTILKIKNPENETDTDEILILSSVEDGRFLFRKFSLVKSLELQSKGLESETFDRASRQWESNRLLTASSTINKFLPNLLKGFGKVSKKDFSSMINSVLKTIAPDVNPSDIVYEALSGDSFVRTETRGSKIVVVIDKDKMVEHLRSLFGEYDASVENPLYHSYTSNEVVRQLSAWIDEEQVHRIALPLYSDEDLKKFLDEAMEAGKGTEFLRTLITTTMNERLSGVDIADLTVEQNRMIVHEVLRKIQQLKTTGSTSEMQNFDSMSMMKVINSGVDEKGQFSKIKTVLAMIRRYLDRVRNLLAIRRIEGRLTQHQRSMLNKLQSAYDKANLKGDIDLITRKTAEHSKWISDEWQKDYEFRMNKAAMNISDEIGKLKAFPKRLAHAGLDDIVLFDGKTGMLSLSPYAKALIEEGIVNADIEAINKALDTMNDIKAGHGAQAQLVYAKEALDAARANISGKIADLFALGGKPADMAIWDALKANSKNSIEDRDLIIRLLGKERDDVESSLSSDLANQDLNILRELSQLDMSTNSGNFRAKEIASKIGFRIEPNEQDNLSENPSEAWKTDLLNKGLLMLENNGSLAKKVNALAATKTQDEHTKKLDEINKRLEELDSSEAIGARAEASLEQQEDYQNYINYLSALEKYNDAQRYFINRALGDFSFNRKELGLDFRDVSNVNSIGLAEYGLDDVSEDSPEKVNGYHFVNGSRAATLATSSDSEYDSFYGGWYYPSRDKAPELYQRVSSNAIHQGHVMFERFVLIQAQQVVPLSDIYQKTAGFNISVTTNTDGVLSSVDSNEVFYRWKADNIFSFKKNSLKKDEEGNYIPPTSKEIVEALGADPDAIDLGEKAEGKKGLTTYYEYLNEAQEWINDFRHLIDPSGMISTIGGTQTLGARQAVLLSRRLDDAQKMLNEHKEDVDALYRRAEANDKSASFFFADIFDWNNRGYNGFLQSMWMASADVMMARVAYNSFVNPVRKANIRKDASKTTQDAGYEANIELKPLRDRPVDLPTYFNYSWWLSFLATRKSDYFSSAVYANDLLRDFEKGNWSNDEYELWTETVVKKAKRPVWVTNAEKMEDLIPFDHNGKRMKLNQIDGNQMDESEVKFLSELVQLLVTTGQDYAVIPFGDLSKYVFIDRNGDLFTSEPSVVSKGRSLSKWIQIIRESEDGFVFAQSGRDADGRGIRPSHMTDSIPLEQDQTQARMLKKLDAPEMIRRRAFTKSALLIGMTIPKSQNRELGISALESAQRFFHDISGLERSNPKMLASVVRRGLAGLFNVSDFEFNRMNSNILDQLIQEFERNYTIQANDPVELLHEMIRFKADKELALLNSARLKSPDLATEALITLVAEATKNGRNADMIGTNNELDQFHKEVVKRSVSEPATEDEASIQLAELPNSFISEDEIAAITRHAQKDMALTAGKSPFFSASLLLNNEEVDIAFVSENKIVSMLVQRLLGDVVIYSPARPAFVDGRSVGIRIIPGWKSGPTVIYAPQGIKTGREESFSLIATALSIHAKNNPERQQGLLDFASKGIDRVAPLQFIEKMVNESNISLPQFERVAKRIVSKELEGSSADELVVNALTQKITSHLVQLAYYADARNSLENVDVFRRFKDQPVTGAVIFFAELMTNPKVKELYDYMSFENSLSNVPSNGHSVATLMSMIQAIEDVTRSEMYEAENQAFKEEIDNEPSISGDQSDEYDFTEEEKEDIRSELAEGADLKFELISTALEQMAKDAGENLNEDFKTPDKSIMSQGITDSLSKINTALINVFKDSEVHAEPSAEMAQLVRMAKEFGNTGLKRGDADILTFLSGFLGLANEKIKPFDAANKTNYQFDTHPERIEALKKEAGETSYGNAVSAAVLSDVNRGGSFYLGNLGSLGKSDNPSNESIGAHAMNKNRFAGMAAGVLALTKTVREVTDKMIEARGEEIALSRMSEKKDDWKAGYGRHALHLPISDRLINQLAHVLPGSFTMVDGIPLNRIQIEIKRQESIIEETLQQKEKALRLIESARTEQERIKAFDLGEESFDIKSLNIEDEESVNDLTNQLVAELESSLRKTSDQKKQRSFDVATAFERLTQNESWTYRRVEVEKALNDVVEITRSTEKDDNIYVRSLNEDQAIDWANHLITRFEEETNNLLEYILKANYGVTPVSTNGDKTKLITIPRVDKDGENASFIPIDIKGVFRADTLKRKLNKSFFDLDRGSLGDLFLDVFTTKVQTIEDRLAGPNEKSKPLLKGKPSKGPRTNEELESNAKKNLNLLIKNLESKFNNNVDKEEVRAYIRSLLEYGLDQSAAAEVSSEVGENGMLLSSAIGALVASPDMRLKMNQNSGRISLATIDALDKANKAEAAATAILAQSEREILGYMKQLITPLSIGFTKTIKENVVDSADKRPEMGLDMFLAPDGLDVSPEIPLQEQKKLITQFQSKRGKEILAQVENKEKIDFSFVAKSRAISAELNKFARNEIDDTYKLLRGDSQYFSDFNPQKLLQNALRQSELEKLMIDSRIDEARRIATNTENPVGWQHLGVDALAMLTAPSSGTSIVTVKMQENIQDRIDSLTASLSKAEQDLAASKIGPKLTTKKGREERASISSAIQTKIDDLKRKLKEAESERRTTEANRRTDARVSWWSAPKEYQARRDLLGRLVNDDGQWVVLAATNAREDLARRFQETGRKNITFENFVLEALAPTLTDKNMNGNKMSRINFSAVYLDEPTKLDLSVNAGKTLGKSRREAGEMVKEHFNQKIVTLLNRRQKQKKESHSINMNDPYVKDVLDRFGYMVQAIVHSYDHALLTTEVKEKLNDWLGKIDSELAKTLDGHFINNASLQNINLIEMFADVFADIEGGYIMDTLAAGLAVNPRAHSLTMLKYLHHQDGRNRARFIRDYVSFTEAERMHSLLDRGFDDGSGRFGAKTQYEAARKKLLKTQKALGSDSITHAKAYLHASLQGLIETRSGKIEKNLSRWIFDFEKGALHLNLLDDAQKSKYKNRVSRFFNAMHVDLLRDIEMVKDVQKVLSPFFNKFLYESDLSPLSLEKLSIETIKEMQIALEEGALKNEIKAHSKVLVETFNGITDAMEITKALMSQPKVDILSLGEGVEFNKVFHSERKPNSEFLSTVPLRFHYASNPEDNELDRAAYEENKRIDDPIDIVRLEESTLYGGAGKHMEEKGKAPYRPINLNGLSAVDSMLEDAFYRMNVTPAYTILRKVIGREEPTKTGMSMISNDAKILRPINKLRHWMKEKTAQRAALAAVAREMETVIGNDSSVGVYNTEFAETTRFLSSMYTVKALLSPLQLWNQTAPASLMMVMKKLIVGDTQGAIDFMKIASRHGSSGVSQMLGSFSGKEPDGFSKKVEDWIMEVDPWISFRGTDGMDQYRNILRSQRRHGVGTVKQWTGKATKQLEALQEIGLDKTIGLGERWIARSMYLTELLTELRNMKKSGVIDIVPTTVDELLEIPGHLIPAEAKNYARMKVNDMMGQADQSKKAFLFQSHSRFPGVQALTRSLVRFSNHTATTGSNMTALLPALRRLDANATPGEHRMRQEAIENIVGTLGQNTLFHLMKLHTMIPLLAYIIFNIGGDDDDEAQIKAQALADSILAPADEDRGVGDYIKGLTFGKENQLFQDWRDPESARRSAYANLLGKTISEMVQAFPIAGVAFSYMPMNTASKMFTDPIAENLMTLGSDLEVSRNNMNEEGVRIYERNLNPVERLAQLTAPSAELYNLLEGATTVTKSLMLEDNNPLETAAYFLSEFYATRELRGLLESSLKKKIRDEN